MRKGTMKERESQIEKLNGERQVERREEGRRDEAEEERRESESGKKKGGSGGIRRTNRWMEPDGMERAEDDGGIIERQREGWRDGLNPGGRRRETVDQKN